MKLNCWEFKKCGREPGGIRASDLGVCPASMDRKANGMNDGHNGGRICWALAGTLCGGTVQGTYAQKLSNCMACDFYGVVRAEQGKQLQSFTQLLQNRS